MTVELACALILGYFTTYPHNFARLINMKSDWIKAFIGLLLGTYGMFFVVKEALNDWRSNPTRRRRWHR